MEALEAWSVGLEFPAPIVQVVVGLEESWQSHAYAGYILDLEKDDCDLAATIVTGNRFFLGSTDKSRTIGIGNPSHTDQALRGFHVTIPANRPSRVGFLTAKPMRSPTPWVYPFGLWAFHSDIEITFNVSVEHIKEIQFLELLSNVVLVPKPGEKWRMCTNFRDLNKACPKDFYPLPKIDQLVDSTSGCELLSMMDASQGENLPFFKVLRKTKNFEWDVTCQQAFKNSKNIFIGGDTLYLYLSAIPQAVSFLLIREDEGKQMPNYYVSKDEDELATKTDIGQTRHLQKISKLVRETKISLDDTPKIKNWLLYVDGSSAIDGSGVGIVITSPQGEDLEFIVKFSFKASDNEAEYEALVIGLKMAHESGA
ncbi:UNVERIFIED_CONTAM: hypothetical protein Scaly_2789900 [Sesamum calycinum]|uniref:RNase H type-1 domain-containing protein n=1 Tax=Sesamum calycinum TaxID=2727403 RepID=A0AAW2IWL8_9LAMI